MMAKILTADQFVAGVIAALALKGRKIFVLKNSELDEKFEKAFQRLISEESKLDVVPNFSFYTDKIHGDSTSLRETLLAAKEKEMIALHNPTFHTFEIKLSDERANKYLSKVPLPAGFLNQVVDEFFMDDECVKA